jgi:nucleoside-diphosphate-sugar epimerase
MMRGAILVTGAGGFVCSEITLALHRAGADVVATDRVFDAECRARLEGIPMIEAPLDEALGNTRLAELSGVIHGAAITASPETLGLTHAAHIRCNMDALTVTLDHAAEAGASRLLFISSMGVFNPTDAPVTDDRFTENTIPTADCTYCAAKQAGEILTAAAAQTGFTTLSLRLGNVFGPHEAIRESRQHLCLASRMLKEARETDVITVQTPDAVREWSWLPDLADFIANLMQDMPSDGPRVWHAGTPPTITDLDLAKAVATRAGHTVIRMVPPPHAVIRPPMGSSVPTLFDKAGWTPINDALDQMIHLEVGI